MPTKTQYVLASHLINIPLPKHGKSYSVIPHGHAINETYKALFSAGFRIESEEYKCTLDGQVAQGLYRISYGNDPDMGLMFAWSNSYNKSRRFKCAVGGHVFACMNGVLKGDMGSYVRKHTGSALYEATLHINEQVANAKAHFELLVKDKEMLKNVTLSPKEKGTILGRLFAEQEILTLTQVGIVKREMDKPSHSYNCNPDSAWAMYNNVTYALRESHPQTYLQDHETLHNFFVNEYGQLITNAPVTQTVLELPEPEEEPVYETESSSLFNGVVFL